MRNFILTLLLTFSFVEIVLSQTNARISDVDFRIENNVMIVNYTLSGSLPAEIFTVGLRFLTENNQEIIPVTIMGDIGPDVKGDGSKTIFWYIETDKFEYKGILRASVSLAFTGLASKPLGGPGYAFLSMIVPSLGGYFVYKSKACPVLTTLSMAGLVIYGSVMGKKADDLYAQYETSKDYYQIQNLYDDANKAHHKSFIAYRLAIGLYITDIIGVAIKGSNNKKAAQSPKHTFNSNGVNLYYVNNGIQLGYKRVF